MKNTYLLLSAVLVLQIPESLLECRILQTRRGVTEYGCDSNQELEEQGSSEMQHVTIFDDKVLPIISSSTFQKTPNLQRLELRKSISGMNRGAFQALKELSFLSIYNNELRELKTDTFANLQLKYLDLSYNSIIYVEPGTFFNLTNLKTLYLRCNNLGRISSGIFNDLPVERLGLSKNRIAFLERNAFANLTNLKRLHLDGNRLTEFQAETLMTYGHKLEILWLHNNSFSEISRKTVKGLDNLRLLNLQDNVISKILPYTFENVLNLEVLVLSNNSLITLDAEVFPEGGMPKLWKLYLNDNHFSYLTTKVLGRLAHLKGIRIGGNPWQCPCLETILVWLTDHEVKQNCDKEYYNGTRPICVVVDAHPTACVYENDQFYYQRYIEVNNKLPKTRPCAL